MKKYLRWIDINGEVVICGIFFFAMLIIISIQIFMRNIVGHGLRWAEEITRYLHVWVTYIGIAYSTRMNSHIRIDFIQQRFPEKFRKFVIMFLQFVLLALFIVLFVGSIQDVEKIARLNSRAESINISQNWMYMAAPIGYALCILRLIQSTIWKFRTFNKSWSLFDDREGVYSGSLETFCYPEDVIEDMIAMNMTEEGKREYEEMQAAKGGAKS